MASTIRTFRLAQASGSLARSSCTLRRATSCNGFKQQQRHASFYNADVAGLTEDEAEVIVLQPHELEHINDIFLSVSRRSYGVCTEGSGSTSRRS